MTAGTLVRLTKPAEHKPGLLSVGYWLEGKLSEDVRVGATIIVHRHRRARQQPHEPEVVECPGLYVSSPVTELIRQSDDSVLAVTQNSTWMIQPIGSQDRPEGGAAVPQMIG